MFEKFTELSIKVIMVAQEEARRFGHSHVAVEHILIALSAFRILPDTKISLTDVRKAVESVMPKEANVVYTEMPFSAQAKKLLDQAVNHIEKEGYVDLQPTDLLVGLLAEKNSHATRICNEYGITYETLLTELSEIKREKVADVLDRFAITGVDYSTEMTPSTNEVFHFVAHRKRGKVDYSVVIRYVHQNDKGTTFVGEHVEKGLPIFFQTFLDKKICYIPFSLD